MELKGASGGEPETKGGALTGPEFRAQGPLAQNLGLDPRCLPDPGTLTQTEGLDPFLEAEEADRQEAEGAEQHPDQGHQRSRPFHATRLARTCQNRVKNGCPPWLSSRTQAEGLDPFLEAEETDRLEAEGAEQYLDQGHQGSRLFHATRFGWICHEGVKNGCPSCLFWCPSCLFFPRLSLGGVGGRRGGFLLKGWAASGR